MCCQRLLACCCFLGVCAAAAMATTMNQAEQLELMSVCPNVACIERYLCGDDPLYPANKTRQDFCEEYKADTRKGKRHAIKGTKKNKERAPHAWLYGTISVTCISSCSLLGISVLPVIKKPVYNKILLYLISLSVGTLSGNAIFMLIPEGFELEEGSGAIWRSLVAVAGIYMFFMVEMLLENLFKTRHNHQTQQSCMSAGYLEEGRGQESSADALIVTSSTSTTPVHSKESMSTESSEVSIKTSVFDLKGIKPIAWMITVADGLHNFIDGIAIGTSFAVSPMQGFSTSLAIFCEELPHELGDFAILLKAGMNIKQAAIFNFASGCCCYLGLIAGILLGETLENASWIFAMTGGVFLYIALAGMLPEAKAHALCPQLIHRPWLCFALQNAGMLTGFLAMFLLTMYEDSFKVLAMQHEAAAVN